MKMLQQIPLSVELSCLIQDDISFHLCSSCSFGNMLKLSQNKKGQNFSSRTKNGVFLQLAAEKKTPFLCSQKISWHFLFCDGFRDSRGITAQAGANLKFVIASRRKLLEDPFADRRSNREPMGHSLATLTTRQVVAMSLSGDFSSKKCEQKKYRKVESYNKVEHGRKIV